MALGRVLAAIALLSWPCAAQTHSGSPPAHRRGGRGVGGGEGGAGRTGVDGSENTNAQALQCPQGFQPAQDARPKLQPMNLNFNSSSSMQRGKKRAVIANQPQARAANTFQRCVPAFSAPSQPLAKRTKAFSQARRPPQPAPTATVPPAQDEDSDDGAMPPVAHDTRD